MANNGTALAEISAARQALARASDIYSVLEIRDIAKAASTLAEARGAGEVANEAKEVQLRAERKAGAFLKVLERNPGGDGSNQHVSHAETKAPSDYAATLEDAGIPRPTAHRWQKIADVPEPVFEAFVAESKADGRELTQAAALALAKNGTPHVAHNSGNNEWYTPKEYIDAARYVMGGIDLDPASSEAANRLVGAAAYYTAEDNGLAQRWYGRVWMNPPYARELVGAFTETLVDELLNGAVEQACVLVNNATDARWFQAMLGACTAVCFPEGRVKFLDPDGNPSGAPLQGQAVLYFGPNRDGFRGAFSRFGPVLIHA